MCGSMVIMERSILDLNASSVPNLFLVQRRWYTLVDHCCLGLPTLRFTIVRGIGETYLNVVSLIGSRFEHRTICFSKDSCLTCTYSLNGLMFLFGFCLGFLNLLASCRSLMLVLLRFTYVCSRPRILRNPLNWTAFIFCNMFGLSCTASKLYTSFDLITASNTFSLKPIGQFDFFQKKCNLFNVAIQLPTLMLISCLGSSEILTNAPK